MDIMMVLSTDDVKRLKNKFVRPLSVDEFVFIMMKCLHDHIHNELEFVISVIELYETIDVNGDGSLEWDEFAGYIVDAGIAKAEEAIVAQATIKLYSPLVFKGEAANSIQPMAADRTYIQQVTILAGRQALAYYEHASDVVHIYLFGHDRDVEPRFASTIRLHTAYQAHKVLYIEDIATRSSLAISSYLTTGCITVWDVTRLYNPIPLQRVDMAVPQEVLTWVPSHQLLLAATTQSTYKTTAKKPQQHQFTFVTALDIATLERVPLDVGVKHVTALCVVKRSTRTAVAIGSMDGTITVHDMAKESQHPSHNIVVDAHEKGVKGLTYSVKFGYLASMGHYSFAEESTMEVLVWHFDDENARVLLDRALSGHHAALCAVTTVDSESHLVSGDEGGMMRVWSVSTWDCLQTFHTSQHISTLRCQVVWPTSPQADALLMCAGKSVEFHDCALVREREEFLFVDFNATFNVILAATYHRLILWDMASGDMRKTYELHVIYNGKPATHSVTAVCLDDRERKLIVGDDAGQVLVVNLVNGNLMKELDPHAQAISSLSYVASSKCVVSTAIDATIHICDENNAHGYYVPFAGAPLSVLLRSLRLSPAVALLPPRQRRHTMAIVASSSVAPTSSSHSPDIDVLTSVSSDSLRLIATVSSCSIGESYVQLWDFDSSVLVQTCVAPDPTAEISCVVFLPGYPGLVAGLSTGEVFVWGVRPSPASSLGCLFQLTQWPLSPSMIPAPSLAAHAPAITSLLTLPLATTDEPPGVLIFAGDEAGQVTRWTLPYDAIVGSGLVANDADGDDDGVTTEATFVTALPSRQPVTATRCSTPSVASTTSSATSGRHTHTDVAWDTMAKSARSAKLASASPAPVASDVQWQVDGGGVTKLAKASVTLDVYSVLTCVATGKIQAWSVDGVDQGTLDYFATRRQPVHAPWRLPVDRSLRLQQQQVQANAVLQQVRGVTALLQNLDVKPPNHQGPQSYPNMSSKLSTPATPASRQPRTTTTSPNSVDAMVTPRTATRFQTLGQLVSRNERRALQQPDNDEDSNVSLDVVLHDIGKLNQVARTTHTRKKRTIHTADTIMERSLSMPTLLLKPAATAAAVKSRKGGSSKGKTPLLSRSTTSTCVLPPLDLRHELAEMALAKQHQVDVADSDSTQSVLSYHLKLAHAWQQ
ncbi:hypothetical protein H257_08744 [Aphanomyces astaci]|uniref:EF-hand domain-containing protein n=1 Tax=Aphanomyces astaci TaxID=112090 RepID=W4GDD9_APHAT|nr:hypothetical protein H257_08744 [Aphanomyces astaci]ETV77296.1 hypothetical protein H257_08744 [Aphanomyces astaci]|eukprot:XP_009833083.1 hypothetical protein H257_08744 [Aphanomyces astaci]